MADIDGDLAGQDSAIIDEDNGNKVKVESDGSMRSREQNLDTDGRIRNSAHLKGSDDGGTTLRSLKTTADGTLCIHSVGTFDIQEDTSVVVAGPAALDFGAGFDVTDAGSSVANVVADPTEMVYDNSGSGLTATNIQAAIDEVQANITDDQTATEVSFTPNGDITSTNVQDAIVEVRDDTDTKLALKQDLSEKGVANGYASLDAGGKVPTAQLPALALTEVYAVADISARDALTVQEGDIAIVTNAGSGSPATFAYDGAAWQELLSPTDAVTSVNGQVGVVVLDTDDISEGATNFYYTTTRFDTDFAAKDTDDLSEGTTNLYFTETRVTNTPAVVANTAKVSADGPVSTHSDVDTTGANVGDLLEWNGTNWVPVTKAVYGTEFNLFESSGITVNTSSTTGTAKVTGTTGTLPIGKYRITVSYNWALDSTGTDFVAALEWDGTFLGKTQNTTNEYIHFQEPQDSGGGNPNGRGTNQSHGFCQQFFVDVATAGTKTITLYFRPNSGGVEASMWDASLEIVRVE